MSDIKTALKIYRRLLKKGQLDRESEADLFLEFRNVEVRAILAEFEEELDFKAIEVGGSNYLLPNSGNGILGFTTKDLREGVATDARLVDAYLLSYISMFILYLFESQQKAQAALEMFAAWIDQITSYIKDLTIEPEKDFRPEQDVKAQTEGLGEGYQSVENQTRAQADRLRNNYTGLKVNYRERNANISNIFKGLDQLWDKASMIFDDFYYLYERMSLHKEKLKELIKLHETQLSNLEHNKKDMVQQSLLQAMRFYEEIDWISNCSKVPLQGRSRPVQMLKVELSLDSNEAAGTRMKDYIEECIAKVDERELENLYVFEKAIAGKRAGYIISFIILSGRLCYNSCNRLSRDG